ncbi:MAG: hypothetical protein Q8Q42_04085 [Nanoarchaeota archaeon]|nr:hypothetical protein [Nanoarchaeota archaeon]
MKQLENVCRILLNGRGEIMNKNKTFFWMAVVLGMMFMFNPQIQGNFSFIDGVFRLFDFSDEPANIAPGSNTGQASGGPSASSPGNKDDGGTVPPMCCDPDEEKKSCKGSSVKSCTLKQCALDSDGDGAPPTGYYWELSACENGCVDSGETAWCYGEYDFDDMSEFHGCIYHSDGTSSSVNKYPGDDTTYTQDCAPTQQVCVLGSPNTQSGCA